jgi:hypothetical protein
MPAVDAGAIASGTELLMQLEQFAGRAVGAMDDEAQPRPSVSGGFGAMALERRLILAPRLRPSGGDGSAFGLDEFDRPE